MQEEDDKEEKRYVGFKINFMLILTEWFFCLQNLYNANSSGVRCQITLFASSYNSAGASLLSSGVTRTPFMVAIIFGFS